MGYLGIWEFRPSSQGRPRINSTIHPTTINVMINAKITKSFTKVPRPQN
jgi:hypothetical protein